MSANMGPAHDRVRLSAAEQRALAELARCFDEEPAPTARMRDRWWRAARTFGAWLWRAAPWLVPFGVVAMVIAGAWSTAAGAILGLVTSILLLMALLRVLAKRAQDHPRERPRD